MTKDFDYRLFVEVPSNGSLTLTTVLSTPRQCSPGEVLSACENMELTTDSTNHSLPPHLKDFAGFVVKDFFALAHRTGLYNRQQALWKAIGRVVEIKIDRPQIGWFKKTEAPYADFFFFDSKGNCVIWACLLDLPSESTQYAQEKGRKRFISDCISRAKKFKKEEETLAGLFIGLPEPIGEPVFAMVARLTGAKDPIRRYEALLPAPLEIPCNLLQTKSNRAEEGSLEIELAYPRLKSQLKAGLELKPVEPLT